MFEAVQRMNLAFGNPKGNPLDFETVESGFGVPQSWRRLEKQCDNIGGSDGGPIAGEVKELHHAIRNQDIEGVRDALCDIMVFALGAHHIMGYDARRDMDSVIAGVMTRFCHDANDVALTRAKYKAVGVELRMEGTFPFVCLKSTHDQIGTDGDIYPEGKFVKSVSYKKTVFYQAERPKPKENESGFARRRTDPV